MTRRYAIYAADSNGTYPIYVVGDKDACVYNAILNEALNDAGTLTFTVPPTNPEYDKLTARVKILVFENEEVTWRGFVAQTDKNKNNELKVTAIGELGYLNDTIQPQHKYQSQTPTQLLTAYLAEHNAQSSETFTVGIVTVTDPNDSVYRFTNYETTLTCLRDDLCASLDGYLRIRYESGVRYLDLVKLVDYGVSNGQIIEFGENLLDYAEGMSAEEVATQCLPLGARLDEAVVNGLDAYLDIKSVNGGVDYVQDDDAVAAFGEIKRVVHFDNVTDPTTLKNKGINWLTTAQYAKISIQVSAIDLSALTVYIAHKRWVDFTDVEWQELGQKTWGDLMQYTDSSLDPFRLGDRVRCFAIPYGMDATFPIQEKTTYLQDPTKNIIVLSAEKTQTYTQMQAAATATAEKQNQSFLAQAQQMATDIITNATEGYVYIKYGADGTAEELCIMDTDSPDTATKVWRWNMNGFGYSPNGYNGPYTTAMTMSGEIVADFITTGTMLANRIKGGTLELGGLNDEYGIFKMLDNDGTTRIQISNNIFKLTPREHNAVLMNWTGTDYANNKLDGSLYTSGLYLFRNWNTSVTPSTSDYWTAYNENGWITRRNISGGNIQYYFGCGPDGMSCQYNGTTKISTSTASGNVTAVSFTNTSEEKTKEDIKPLGKTLDIVNKADICTYKVKDEAKKRGAREHIGMVIGDKYNTPDELIVETEVDGKEETLKGIDLYAMCSMLWKAVQELSEELDQLKGEKKDALDK